MCVCLCVCGSMRVCDGERGRGGELRANIMEVREGGRCREWHQREGGVETSGGWENVRGGVGDREGNLTVLPETGGFHGDN